MAIHQIKSPPNLIKFLILLANRKISTLKVFFFSYFSGGEGLWMDAELAKGRSTKCETFHNSSLTANEGGDFSIVRVDVFGFQ